MYRNPVYLMRRNIVPIRWAFGGFYIQYHLGNVIIKLIADLYYIFNLGQVILKLEYNVIKIHWEVLLSWGQGQNSAQSLQMTPGEVVCIMKR